MKRFLSWILISFCAGLWAQTEFSTAGFFQVPHTGRTVFSMNPAWRLHKGEVPNAFLPEFDDAQWQVVNLSNGIELLPLQASGGINY